MTSKVGREEEGDVTVAAAQGQAKLNTRRWKREAREDLGVFGLLVVIYCVFVFASPGFALFSIPAVQDLLLVSAPMIVLTVGTAYVLIVGEIDLSIGGTLALTSVLGAKAIIGLESHGLSAGWSICIGLIICVLVGGAAGFVNGYISLRFRIPSFLVTLGTA
ncbi:MAG: hypothetical protein M3Z35_10920, partial [Nitrospirota bacterium]|nr:hypothetical protein [Nitrospirota bacterium]